MKIFSLKISMKEILKEPANKESWDSEEIEEKILAQL